MTSNQNHNQNQRMSYFLPHVMPSKKVQAASIYKKNSSMKKDQSLPEITPIYESPLTNKRAQRKKAQNNEEKNVQNQANIIRKNKSDRKIGASPIQLGQKRGQLTRKIQSFKKLYANKIDSEPLIKKKNEILTANKDQSNRKILDRSRAIQTNKQQKLSAVKSPLLHNKNKLDRESFFAQNPKYSLKNHKQSSPLLKIGQSESILQMTDITSNPISSPAKTKIIIENKKVTAPTEHAYSTTATKLSNSQQARTQKKKKNLEEQIMQLDKKLSKSSHQSPVKKNRFYQSLDKEFTKKKASIDQLSKQRGIDDHEDKISKLKQMGIEYMEDYLQFQEMLMQLRLHRQMLKRQSQVDTVVSQY